MHSVDLEHLVRAARSGCQDARNELLRRLSSYLFVIADDRIPAELRGKFAPSDVVQETLLEASRGLATFDGASVTQFKAWLRRILVNKIHDLHRKFRRASARDIRRELRLDGAMAGNVAEFLTPSAILGREERNARLLRAIERLPNDRRQVVIFRSFDRLSFAEIAARMGRSCDAVRFLWYRAIHSLRSELEGE